MRKIACLSIVIIFLACNNNSRNIKGDLYIKLIDFPSFYGVSDANFAKFKKIIDSINYQENISTNEQNLVDYYYKLDKLNLLKTPFIKIRTKENVIKKIFLNPKEYKRVKDFTWGDLTSKKKKVSLELKIIELDSLIYYSDEIISLKIVDGTTYWDK
jgi:hypothetical protein